MFEYSCARFALPTASHAIANTTDRLAVWLAEARPESPTKMKPSVTRALLIALSRSLSLSHACSVLASVHLIKSALSSKAHSH